MTNLKGKTILLGVTGSIAAFKAAALASKLTAAGANVDVVATQNALKLVGAATFEGLTHRKCYFDTFASPENMSSSHITIGTNADLALIAPCTANMIGKLAHGIADDKLSTTMLVVRCPVYIAPAMNCFMYENTAVQENLEILRRRGFHIIEPGSGNLACGYAGKGRMPEPEDLLELCLQQLGHAHNLAGKRVLITAGPTREPIDAVRYISNPSTGKMGYACARAALMAGAQVTLISGPCALKPVQNAHMIDVQTAAEMAHAVFDEAPRHDIVIMTAAVADFTPSNPVAHKIHKTDADLSIPLDPTADILSELGKKKHPGQLLCGFCMETESVCARAAEKLRSKNLDMIVANSLAIPGSGFAADTNAVHIITPDSSEFYDTADKLDIALHIIDHIVDMISSHE